MDKSINKVMKFAIVLRKKGCVECWNKESTRNSSNCNNAATIKLFNS